MKQRKSMDGIGSYFKRCGQRTPPFFRKLRTLGLIVIAGATALLTTPVDVPQCLTDLSSYLVVAGTVAVAMSQATIGEGSDCEDN
ncbi:MAG: hypothetical protein ACFHU9_18150 [Fluviicola sp.]